MKIYKDLPERAMVRTELEANRELREAYYQNSHPFCPVIRTGCNQECACYSEGRVERRAIAFPENSNGEQVISILGYDAIFPTCSHKELN